MKQLHTVYPVITKLIELVSMLYGNTYCLRQNAVIPSHYSHDKCRRLTQIVQYKIY